MLLHAARQPSGRCTFCEHSVEAGIGNERIACVGMCLSGQQSTGTYVASALCTHTSSPGIQQQRWVLLKTVGHFSVVLATVVFLLHIMHLLACCQMNPSTLDTPVLELTIYLSVGEPVGCAAWM